MKIEMPDTFHLILSIQESTQQAMTCFATDFLIGVAAAAICYAWCARR